MKLGVSNSHSLFSPSPSPLTRDAEERERKTEQEIFLKKETQNALHTSKSFTQINKIGSYKNLPPKPPISRLTRFQSLRQPIKSVHFSQKCTNNELKTLNDDDFWKDKWYYLGLFIFVYVIMNNKCRNMHFSSFL